MHVFEVLFLYSHENRAELSSLPIADLRRNSQILYFTKTTLQKMSMTAVEIYDTTETNQIKITPVETSFLCSRKFSFFFKNLSSIDAVLGSSPSPTSHAKS